MRKRCWFFSHRLPQKAVRSCPLALVLFLFSDDLPAQNKARLTNVHPTRANSQVLHLPLVFPTERAAQPLLFLRCFRAMTQDHDAFIADIGPSWPCNEALDLVL